MNLGYLYHDLFWNSNRPFVDLLINRPNHISVSPATNRFPAPPFIVVGNHGNFFDPWIVGCCSHIGLAIMMNDDGFRAGAMSLFYLRSIGAFPKKKGAHDFKAMKITLNKLKNRRPVLIFPEGQTTWDGATQPIYGGIERIVKRARCPLVIARLEGNFLSKPWWADYSRRGRIHLDLRTLDTEQLAAMSEEEVLATIKQGIANNDIKNPANRSVSFRGKNLAEGLERFVWRCMHCESEDRLATRGDTIRCTACNSEWRIDGHMDLHATSEGTSSEHDLYDWAESHREAVRRAAHEASGDDELTHSDGVLLQCQQTTGRFADRATGRLAVSATHLQFSPDGETEPSLRWSLETVGDYVVQKKDIFECRVGSDYFRFVFQGHSPMKWVYYLRYLNNFEEVERRGHY